MVNMPSGARRRQRSIFPVPVRPAVLCLLLLPTIQLMAQAPATSSLLGCVFDTMAYPIPGTTIVARGGGVERTTRTDDTGCYMLKQLPSASYRVTARVQGFDNATYDRVVGHADFMLHISRMCDCVRMELPQTLPEAWERAGAVIYLRLSEADPRTPAQPYYYRHVGAVLEVLKADPVGGPTGGTTAVLEHQENNAPPPLAAGQEVVVFTSWVSDFNAFVALGADCCDNPEVAFNVVDGRIRQAPAPLSGYVGMEIGRFLQELRFAARAREHLSTRLPAYDR